MRVSVTRKHIRTGSITGDSCPVALALREAGVPCRMVGFETFTTYDDMVFRLPHSASKFIGELTFSSPVSPFTFEIDYER